MRMRIRIQKSDETQGRWARVAQSIENDPVGVEAWIVAVCIIFGAFLIAASAGINFLKAHSLF